MQILDSKLVYEKRGTVEVSMGAIILLITGIGVATLVLIFVGVLGGQVYSQVEPDINAINDSTIQGYIKDGIASGFKSLKVTGNYLPIVVMAIIIFIVLALVMQLGRPAYATYSSAL